MNDFWIMGDFWIMDDSWNIGDFWIMGDSWMMSDSWITGDFSMIDEGGKQKNKQTDRHTHQYQDSAWPKGRAEWKGQTAKHFDS